MPPVDGQQVENLNDALAAEFDAMAADSDVEEEIGDEQAEISEEGYEIDVEENDEEVSEAAEEDTVEQELKDEIAEASDSDYTEPAPERWPSEIKEVYNSLPPEARKAMLDGIYKPMQATYTKSTQELAQMRQTLNPMLETMNQYRNQFERMGVSAEEVFRTQLAWAAHLQQVGAEQGLRDMAAAYGVGKIDPKGQQDEDEQYLTPFERKLKADFQAQSQQLQQLTNTFQSQVQNQSEAAQAARFNEVRQGLNDFINETKDGKPAHPHIEKVAPAIAGLIRGGLVPEADQYGQPMSYRDRVANAYEMAVNLDPSLRSVSNASRTGQMQRTKAARSVDVVAKSASAQSQFSDGNLSEDLAETFDRLSRKVS